MTLKEQYRTKGIPVLKQELGISNSLALPRLMQISVNAGLGDRHKEAKFVEVVEQTLSRITGQKPIKTKARKSIAGFKIREGAIVGMRVTLRGPRMWEFLDKLLHVAIPRIRDFRGLDTKGFDAQGNYSMGLTEQIAFPEIGSDEVETLHGIQITLSIRAKRREQAQALLRVLGFPFKKS